MSHRLVHQTHRLSGSNGENACIDGCNGVNHLGVHHAFWCASVLIVRVLVRVLCHSKRFPVRQTDATRIRSATTVKCDRARSLQLLQCIDDRPEKVLSIDRWFSHLGSHLTFPKRLNGLAGQSAMVDRQLVLLVNRIQRRQCCGLG